MELPKDKTFMYLEDNGDGTTTMTLSIPELGLFESAVTQYTFDQIVGEVGMQMPDEVRADIASKITAIPNMPET